MAALSSLKDQIAKARSRAVGTGILSLDEAWATMSVADLASPQAIADRRRFLEEEAGDPVAAAVALERILQGDELQPVNYLEIGVKAQRAVCKITMRDGDGRLRGYGTGFLIAPDILLTNNHVLPQADWASRSFAEFDFQLDPDNRPLTPSLYEFEPQRLFHTDKRLDFTVVAVARASRGVGRALTDFGFLRLIPQTGKTVEGEWLTIVQHPDGEAKKVCVRENRFLKRTDDVLWYSTDTLGGSSGSPVFNNSWQVVALHHSGVPATNAKGDYLTVAGTVFDPDKDREIDIKWIANEGIRVSRILNTLELALAEKPLIASILNAPPPPSPAATPKPASIAVSPDKTMENAAMSSTRQELTIPIEIDAAGRVRLAAVASGEAAAAYERARARSGEPKFDAPFNPDYAKRSGYDEAFLGKGVQVHLPKLNGNEKLAATLIGPKVGHVLHYDGYSVVMNKRRRLAFYSAANVDFAGRFDMSRPADKWRLDPRIGQDEQIGEFYYKSNQFDRGHLTRREDMEFGANWKAALERATDTFHFTNCSPQHARFNQNKETWQGLERHILESSIERNDFKAQVITGPIFEDDDPAWSKFPDIQYPVRYWKIAAALTTSGKLFATAFLLDQSEAIEEFGIEAADAPFAAFKTYQVKVEEIERLTGLSFMATEGKKSPVSLTEFDPLTKASDEIARRMRRSRFSPREATGGGAPAPNGYVPLSSVTSIILPK